MIIGVLKENQPHENRVAISTDMVKKYTQDGFDVWIEKDAGKSANVPDQEFESAGASIKAKAADILSKADIVLKVARPDIKSEITSLKKGAVIVSLMEPYDSAAEMDALAKAGVTSFALEMIPRITRAQSMDVLSSQSNLAGYKAVLDAAAHYGRAFPMMMTAAGTIPPAKVMIFGAGVAGLQAIATAKRLGAVVSATDVRMAAKEQVESLGGQFVMVEDDEVKQAETSGGYAKEMSDAYKKKQAALIDETLVKQDIAITTALIPGRDAPVLITKEMVAKMKPGSVIVDLATSRGGNCELSKPDEIVTTANGVTIVGHTNVPSRVAADASKLLAKNLYNLVSLFWDKDNKKITINFEDDIITGACLTHGGKIVHANFAKATPSSKAAPKAPAKKPAAKKAPAKKTTPKNKATKKGA